MIKIIFKIVGDAAMSLDLQRLFLIMRLEMTLSSVEQRPTFHD